MKARRQAGFTYLGLIIFVAIIGLVGAATLKIGALLQRAAAEEELLEIGAAFSAALDSYAAATPRGGSPYPPSLAELLKDPRSPAVRRHLRKVYVDPLTGKAEWGIVYLGSGETGVVAIHSLSTARPLKIANFDSRFKGLDNKEMISEWRFSAGERSLAPAVPTTQSGGPGAPPEPSVQEPAPAVAPPPSAPAPAPALEAEPEPEPEPEPESEPAEQAASPA
ncbi:type II secretion system protein [Massilia timonae]|uniref:type II secretion system protein n=1 Tax=Massilia timonae TaxID=47229 RepID=UPI0028A6055C|nr:type II secretion system protein [Massilia timonae]